MEVEFTSVDQVKPKTEGEGEEEEEEKKEQEVAQNDTGEGRAAGSAEGFNLLGNQLLPKNKDTARFVYIYC